MYLVMSSLLFNVKFSLMDCISHDSSNYKGKNAQLKNSLSKIEEAFAFITEKI